MVRPNNGYRQHCLKLLPLASPDVETESQAGRHGDSNSLLPVAVHWPLPSTLEGIQKNLPACLVHTLPILDIANGGETCHSLVRAFGPGPLPSVSDGALRAIVQAIRLIVLIPSLALKISGCQARACRVFPRCPLAISYFGI